MEPRNQTCPMSRAEVLDLYFLEHRAKVLDIAAFLDRVERSASSSEDVRDEYRIHALDEAIAMLIDGQSNRAKRVLDLFSDPTTEPIDTAHMKGAMGVWPEFAADRAGASR